MPRPPYAPPIPRYTVLHTPELTSPPELASPPDALLVCTCQAPALRRLVMLIEAHMLPLP